MCVVGRHTLFRFDWGGDEGCLLRFRPFRLVVLFCPEAVMCKFDGHRPPKVGNISQTNRDQKGRTSLVG